MNEIKFVQVPVEPTDEMLQAGWEEHEGSVEGMYAAMLSAAPKAPQQVSNTQQDGPNIQSLNICPRNSGHPHMFSKPGTIDSCRHCGLSEREWKVKAEAKLLAAQTPQQQEQSGEAVAWLDEQWIDDTCDEIGDLYEKAGTPVKGLAPVAQALREAFAKGMAATASQEPAPDQSIYDGIAARYFGSAPGQEAVAFDDWWDKQGNWAEVNAASDDYAKAKLAWVAAQTTSTAIVALVIRQAAEIAEDYCSDMPDLAGHGHSVGLRDAILTLTPANAEAELEALMMRVAELRDQESAKGYMDAAYQVSDAAIVRRVLDEMKGE
jgi:hypothetical protein